MPDFILVPMAYCVGEETVGPFLVPSSRQDRAYEVRCAAGTWEWSCTCPAFEFSRAEPKTCKHIRQAEQGQCGWTEQSGEEIDPARGGCPRCGGEVRWYQTAT